MVRIPETEYQLHPEGQFTGYISAFEDLGVIDTGKFGPKYKVSIDIKSDQAKFDDDLPFLISKRFNLSSHENAELTKLRVALLGRDLNDKEKQDLEPEELLYHKVGYVVKHNVTDRGTFANVVQIWPGGGKVEAQEGDNFEAPADDKPKTYSDKEQGIKITNAQKSILQAKLDDSDVPDDAKDMVRFMLKDIENGVYVSADEATEMIRQVKKMVEAAVS